MDSGNLLAKVSGLKSTIQLRKCWATPECLASRYVIQCTNHTESHKTNAYTTQQRKNKSKKREKKKKKNNLCPKQIPNVPLKNSFSLCAFTRYFNRRARKPCLLPLRPPAETTILILMHWFCAGTFCAISGYCLYMYIIGSCWNRKEKSTEQTKRGKEIRMEWVEHVCDFVNKYQTPAPKR